MSTEIKEFAITFGVQYGHRSDDPKHPLGMFGDGYAVIEAPQMTIARAIAGAVFGTQWAFIYDLEEFLAEERRLEWNPAGELLRIAWMTPDKQKLYELGDSTNSILSGRDWNADAVQEISDVATALGMPFSDSGEFE